MADASCAKCGMLILAGVSLVVCVVVGIVAWRLVLVLQLLGTAKREKTGRMSFESYMRQQHIRGGVLVVSSGAKRWNVYMWIMLPFRLLQMLSALGDTWKASPIVPNSVRWAIFAGRWLTFLFPIEMGGMDCVIGPTSIYTNLLLTTLTPWLIVVVAFSPTWAKSTHLREYFHTPIAVRTPETARWSVLVFQAVLPAMTRSMMSLFVCRLVRGATESERVFVLTKDPSVQCYTLEHRLWQAYAVGTGFLVVAGLPLLCWRYVNKHTSESTSTAAKTGTRYGC